MVAKIVSGKSIRGILNYNENKVKAGTAELVMASRSAGEAHQLGFNRKLRTLTKKLKAAAEFLYIALLGHLVLTEESYFSFADEGPMWPFKKLFKGF